MADDDHITFGHGVVQDSYTGGYNSSAPSSFLPVGSRAWHGARSREAVAQFGYTPGNSTPSGTDDSWGLGSYEETVGSHARGCVSLVVQVIVAPLVAVSVLLIALPVGCAIASGHYSFHKLRSEVQSPATWRAWGGLVHNFFHNSDSAHKLPNSPLYVSTNALNVRAAPNTDSEILSRFNCGDKVIVQKIENSGWAEIKLPDVDRPAYASRSLLSKTKPNCAP